MTIGFAPNTDERSNRGQWRVTREGNGEGGGVPVEHCLSRSCKNIGVGHLRADIRGCLRRQSPSKTLEGASKCENYLIDHLHSEGGLQAISLRLKVREPSIIWRLTRSESEL